MPVVTSIVVVSILWRFMYAPDGLVNNVLQTVTFNVIQGTDWLSNPSTAMPAIMFMSIWQAVGFHMVIWLSGLQTIPGEQYEAAALDGAAAWQKFRYVTWPGLRETRTFILVTITIAAFSLFAQINVMTQRRAARLHLHRGVPGRAHRLSPSSRPATPRRSRCSSSPWCLPSRSSSATSPETRTYDDRVTLAPHPVHAAR